MKFVMTNLRLLWTYYKYRIPRMIASMLLNIGSLLYMRLLQAWTIVMVSDFVAADVGCDGVTMGRENSL